MLRHRQESRLAKTRKGTGIFRALFAGSSLSLSLSLGCAGANHGMGGQVNDPLLGNAPAAPRPAGILGAPTTASRTTPPNSLTSTAALAAGPSRSLDAATELRIHDAPPGPNHGAAGGAILNRPVPFPSTVAHANPVSPSPSFSPSSRVASYEQAQALLAARGVTWQRLETWGDKGEWKFTCSVPNKQNPFISRNYEAKSRDFLGAMQAVLEQMDKER